MDNEIDCSSSLSSDYWKLYESENYTDLSIHVGREPHSKIFLVHTLVLCTRSKYLENSLAGNTEASKEIQRTTLTFEDVIPDVFEILLRFIYTGKVSYNSCTDIDWINLLKGAVKFELDDLITAIENLLITKNEELIQQNILTVQKFALSTARLNKLLNYCNQTMASHPEIIFKSNNLLSLPKETLITLLQNDDFNMKEGDIWMSVIEWAIGQVPGLTNNPNSWSPGEVNTIKGLVADCIPHVRFVDIAHEELVEKFVFYDELLPAKLRHDILVHHLQNKNKPNNESRPRPRRGYKTVEAAMDTEEQAPFNVNPPASGFSVVAGPSSFSGFGEQRTMVTLKSNTSANPFSNNNNGSGGFGFGGFGGFGQNTSYSNPVEEKKVTSFSGFGNPSLPNASDSTKGFGFGFGSVSNASDLGEKKDTSTFGGIGGSFSLKVSPNASKTVKKNKDKVSPFGQGSLNNNNKSSLFGGLNPNASDSTKAFGGFGNVSNVTDSSEKKNVFGGGSFGRSGFGNVGPNASDSTDGKKAKAFGSAFGSGKSKSNAGNKDGAQGFGFGTR